MAGIVLESIRFKRVYNESSLPKKALFGEPIYCKSNNSLYIGQGTDMPLKRLAGEINMDELPCKIEYTAKHKISFSNINDFTAIKENGKVKIIAEFNGTIELLTPYRVILRDVPQVCEAIDEGGVVKINAIMSNDSVVITSGHDILMNPNPLKTNITLFMDDVNLNEKFFSILFELDDMVYHKLDNKFIDTDTIATREFADNKFQTKTDVTLTTKSKNIPGAINEIDEKKIEAVRDSLNLPGTVDNEYPNLNTKSKKLIGAINEIDAQFNTIVTYKKCDKGANIEISTVADYANIKSLIDKSIVCGVDSFAIMVSHGVNIYTDNVMDSMNSTVSTVLTQVLNYLKSKSLKAHLRVCIYTRDGHGNLVNPSNPSLFLDNWKNILLQYCSIMYPLGFREITISNEMQYLTNGNRSKWQEVINAIKSTYPFMQVGINFNIYDIKTDTVYDLFDILGFNFYPCLSKKGKTENRLILKRAFYNDLFNDDLIPKLLELRELYPNKKLITSEIGTWSDKEGLYLTWKNSYPNAIYDEEPQRIYYELIFELLYEKNTTIDAMYLFAVVENTHRLNGYSFLGKQAENIVKKYWLEV